jgi:CheY-like chemotaxis protein
MPDADGYELLARVRALGAEHGGAIPAISLTAFARKEDRARSLEAGFQAHLAKPVQPQAIITVVAVVTGHAHLDEK